MVQNGNFSGQLYKPGLESAKGASGDGIVFIAPFHNLDSKVPTDVKQKTKPNRPRHNKWQDCSSGADRSFVLIFVPKERSE